MMNPKLTRDPLTSFTRRAHQCLIFATVIRAKAFMRKRSICNPKMSANRRPVSKCAVKLFASSRPITRITSRLPVKRVSRLQRLHNYCLQLAKKSRSCPSTCQFHSKSPLVKNSLTNTWNLKEIKKPLPTARNIDLSETRKRRKRRVI